MLIEQQMQQAQREDGEMGEMPNMPSGGTPNVPNMPSGGNMPPMGNTPSPQMGGQGGHSDRVHDDLKQYNTVYHIEGSDDDEEE